MTIMPKTKEFDNSIFKCCEKFIKRFQVNRLLRLSNAAKEKGFSCCDIFAFLMGLVFAGKNMYTMLDTNSERVGFGKDTVYRFLKNASINWEKFLLMLSSKAVSEIDKLTSDRRKTALIIDDSPYFRNRSKKVEYLSRCFDHVSQKFYKGFTLLTLGWSDGQTFLPISFRLLASGEDKNLLVKSQIKGDKRTLASKRRIDARTDKPSLLLSMLKTVKGTAAGAKYVLFDSWFSSPSSILSVTSLGYHVVSRLKNNENYRYYYKGNLCSISKIYKASKKRRGRSRYLLSVQVEVRHDDFDKNVSAKIVYVRDKANRKKWIALISTDTDLTEEDVIALYGKRWDIEPFHKVIKSALRLEKEFQLRSYDAMTAHATVVMTRYILLSIENRENTDWRSVNDGFFIMCKEMEDISFSFAFQLIMDSMKLSLRDFFLLPEHLIASFVQLFLDRLPCLIKDRLAFCLCES